MTHAFHALCFALLRFFFQTTSRTPVKPTPHSSLDRFRARSALSPALFFRCGPNTKIRDTLNNLIVKVTRFPSAAHPRRALNTCANASSRVRSRLRIGRLGSASPSSPLQGHGDGTRSASTSALCALLGTRSPTCDFDVLPLPVARRRQRVPYEGVSRMQTSLRRKFRDRVVRRGLGLVIESDVRSSLPIPLAARDRSHARALFDFPVATEAGR